MLILCKPFKVSGGGSISSTDYMPTMTGPTNGPITVTESSVETATYAGWHVFDDAYPGDATRWLSLDGGPGCNEWVQIDFGSPVTLGAYQLRHTTYQGGPDDWTFEGSNDGSNWDVLDTQTGRGAEIYVGWVYATIASPAAYQYYRIFVTDTYIYTGYAGIDEMELFQIT